MTTVEQAARDAAEAHGHMSHGWTLRAGDFIGGFFAGHAAARAESETEISALKQDCQTLEWSRAEEVAVRMSVEANNESLRAKLAAMREPLWMLREEHEAEVADLRGKLAEAEGRAPRWLASGSAEMIDLHKNHGWLFVANTDRLINDKWFRLMVPPVQLPETKP